MGARELALGAGLGLVTVGLWPVLQREALVVPGAVLIWLALPTRARLMDPPAAPPLRARERKDVV